MEAFVADALGSVIVEAIVTWGAFFFNPYDGRDKFEGK